MALRLSALVIILSSVRLCRGALVLPRPPSSPNDINQSSSSSSSSSKFLDQKLYNVKTRSQNSRTNVEKPNTDNYKLLEIELRGGGGDGPNGINFGEILREVFRDEEIPIKKEPFNSSSNKLLSFSKKISMSDTPFVDNEKLYYLKQGKISADLSRRRTSWEPRSYLKSVGAYDRGDKMRYATKSFYRPKKYSGAEKIISNNDLGGSYDQIHYRPSSLRDIEKDDDRNRLILGGNNYNELVVTYSNEPAIEIYTTENSLPTSSELPKQIPPPPSRVPNQTIFAHTTPVLKYMSRRTDILPHGYAF